MLFLLKALKCLISAKNSLQVVYQLFYNNNPDIAFWNFIFLLVNTIQVVKLIRERSPVKIPHEIEDIFRTKFSNMTHREFLYFWSLGKQKEITDSTVIDEGEYQKSIFLILSGQAQVQRKERIVLPF